MAANPKSSAIAKRVVTQIWTSNSRHHLTHPPAPVSFLRRGIHDTVYEKNHEDLGQPKTVPDEVIEPQSDKYWAPHPKTGVFGPAGDSNQGDVYSSASRGPDAVMEEKAWFRPSSLEDLEKPV